MRESFFRLDIERKIEDRFNERALSFFVLNLLLSNQNSEQRRGPRFDIYNTYTLLSIIL